MINNYTNFNNFSTRDNYQYLSNFSSHNRQSFQPSYDKIFKTNPNIHSNLSQDKNDSPQNFFYSNNIKNFKGLIKRNQNIISNNLSKNSHTLENKSLNFDISRNINYSKDLLEINNDKNNNNPIKNISISSNNSSINFNPNKIKNFYGPQIRSQSHNNNNINNKSIVSINNNNTSIHNNFQFLSNNDQKISGISVQDNYILFLQKQLDDSVKKNKELILMYKEIEKTCEKLSLENKKLNLRLIESENKFNEYNLKHEELENNNKNIQNESNKKEIELQNKLKESQEQIELLKISLNDYQKNNNELKQNLFLMSNKLTDSLNTNMHEKELNLLKSQNEILTNNLLSKNQNLENLQNENSELITENRILKDQIEDYKSRYNQIKNTMRHKTFSKINQNDSKDSFSTTELMNLTIDERNNNLIYKKKSSSEFSLNKKNNTPKQIEEIKLKLPFSGSKSNPKIKEIPIRYNENIEFENNLFKKYVSDKNIDYNNKSNDIRDLLIKSSNLSQSLRNFDTYNFIINNLEKCLFNIDKDSNLIKFEVNNQKFSKMILINNPYIKIYDDYKQNFLYDESIILNTLNGLFILTGKNTDILYYYNDQNKTIRKICQFNNNHNSGSLYLDKINKKIIVFSGKNNKKVEYYSFENGIINEYPELNIERANATYSFINNKFYALFGFCCPKNSYTQSIEYINYSLMDSWNYISLNKNSEDINLNIHCISNLIIEEKNTIIIFGGIRDEGEIIFDSFLNINCENNLISKISIKNNQNYGCIFTKNTYFINVDNNYLLMDDNDNIHVVDDNMHFSLFKFKL